MLLRHISKRELIHMCELALAHYEVAYRERWSLRKLSNAHMHYGLCAYFNDAMNWNTMGLISDVVREYWQNVPIRKRPNHTIFAMAPMPKECKTVAERQRGLGVRILFLRAFIKELKKIRI